MNSGDVFWRVAIFLVIVVGYRISDGNMAGYIITTVIASLMLDWKYEYKGDDIGGDAVDQEDSMG